MYRIAMLSVHTCPLAALGGKETGGMNVYVRELSRHLGPRGFSVDIYTRSQNPDLPKVRQLWPNVRVIHLPAGPERPYDRRLVYDHLPEFLQNLRDFVRKESVQYDLLHSHYWLSGWVARELSREWVSIPIIHMYHTLGRMKDLAAPAGTEPEPNIRIQVEEEIAHFADVIVAATPLDKEQIINLCGADPQKVRVIPPGVDLELFRPIPCARARIELGLEEPNRQMILFVGRLDPMKGLETLLEAICLLRERHSEEGPASPYLAIIGGEEDEGETLSEAIECLEKLKREVGAEDVLSFLGSRAQDTLPYYYSAAAVTVVPSRYESFGMVALESMACGTPVIASRVGGLMHTVIDGKTGFLVPENDASALADKLQLVLNDAALRERLSVNALQHAQGFGWPLVADRIAALYRDTLV
ncbi:MAG: glycosyltransferase [Chloroflexi bacterium]|nr:glycosyltransferase [Chloroflexota bacterium]